MKIEFVQEFVRLIPLPIRTKTHSQLVKIVQEGVRVPTAYMFSDKDIEELYMKNLPKNPHMVMVYKFVRDNQEIFVNV